MYLLATTLLLALAPHAMGGGTAFERGLPLIEVFEERRHGAGSQVFDVTQAPDGMLYFGALKGVVTYDGAWWRTLELPNESAVFSVESGRGPEIAIGAVDEFGWVAPDTNGVLRFHSLRPHLPEEQRSFGDVRAICTTGSGFLFVAEQFAFSWSGGAPRMVADLRARPASMPRCHRADGTTWVTLGDGTYRYVESGGTLVRAEVAETYTPAVAAWLRGKTVTATAALPDGRKMIGTRQDGIAILDAAGNIEQLLDTVAGLPGRVLSGAIVDREGALWLSYYGVIARLDLDSPVTLIDTRSGLRGSPQGVERHQGRLHISSSHGLFVLGEEGMRAIEGLPVPVWHALSAGEDLLIGTRDGVFVRRGDAPPKRIAGTEGLTVYSATVSKSDPSRVWLATKRGAGFLRRAGGEWSYEGLIPDVPPHAHRIIEVDGELWASTVFDGVARVFVSAVKPYVDRFGGGEMQAVEIDGRPVFIQDGVVSLPASGERVAFDPLFRNVHGDFSLAAQDAHGNIWTNASPPHVLRRIGNGRYADEPIRIGAIDAAKIEEVKAEGDVVWLTASDVLYRYDTTHPLPAAPQPAPLIRRATTADDRPVLTALPPSFGRVRIEFAPASYRPGVLYQYRLDPADGAWSAWTAQPSIDYTNLDHGQYTFRVRSRGAAGAVSEETRWSFTVLPPWYRTRSALILWLILAAVLVAAIVRLRTAALRRQAERLRALVDERTDALQQANAHLERLSLLDELTGIANRRYFQRALVEDWRNAYEERQPLALIFFDLDHFKQVNDRYGHAAGDAALVRVARHLSRRSRRSGELPRGNDLVARIGGEEFAILMTHTTEARAVELAESLRSGIEKVPIELTGTTVHISASAGVASIVPSDSESWSTLMRDADRALYAAKAAGRNCVRSANGDEPAVPYGRVQTPATH
jgi:diguanylate cyclase (GGDEF)-like protein